MAVDYLTNNEETDDGYQTTGMTEELMKNVLQNVGSPGSVKMASGRKRSGSLESKVK